MRLFEIALIKFFLVDVFALSSIAVAKPLHHTSQPVPAAMQAAEQIFTRPSLGFSVVKRSKTGITFEKELSPDVVRNTELEKRLKGTPAFRVELKFVRDEAGTTVDAEIFLLLDRSRKDGDPFDLKDTADFDRLVSLMAEIP